MLTVTLPQSDFRVQGGQAGYAGGSEADTPLCSPGEVTDQLALKEQKLEPCWDAARA